MARDYDPTGGRPSYNAINANAQAWHATRAGAGKRHRSHRRARMLMDGDNDIEACAAVTEWVLKEVFQQLYYANVQLEGIVLKRTYRAGMKSSKQVSVEDVADRTVQILKRCVPAPCRGSLFVRRQSDEQATAHLSAMNARHALPWALTFSYGRALQAAPQRPGAARRRTSRRHRMPSCTAPG